MLIYIEREVGSEISRFTISLSSWSMVFILDCKSYSKSFESELLSLAGRRVLCKHGFGLRFKRGCKLRPVAVFFKTRL